MGVGGSRVGRHFFFGMIFILTVFFKKKKGKRNLLSLTPSRPDDAMIPDTCFRSGYGHSRERNSLRHSKGTNGKDLPFPVLLAQDVGTIHLYSLPKSTSIAQSAQSGRMAGKYGRDI